MPVRACSFFCHGHLNELKDFANDLEDLRWCLGGEADGPGKELEPAKGLEL